MLNQELKDLQKLSAHLRQKLMASMYRHEYFREAEDLEKWITEQMQMATSEDYGHDFEHLLVSHREHYTTNFLAFDIILYVSQLKYT